MEPASQRKRSAFVVRLCKTQPAKTALTYENALVQIILMITLFECQTCFTEPKFYSNMGDLCLSDFVLSCLRYLWFYLSLSFVLRLSHDPISCFYYHRAKIKAVWLSVWLSCARQARRFCACKKSAIETHWGYKFVSGFKLF